MKYFTVKGTNYECGLQLGKKLRRSIFSRLDMIGISDAQVKRHSALLKRIHSLCNKKYPQYIKELEGVAAGAGVDYWRLLLMNCYEFRREERCSNIAICTPKQTILAHNEDGSNEQKKHCALVKFVQKNNTFHSFIYAGEFPGVAYTWNNAGIFFSINYVEPIKINRSKIPEAFIARALVDAKSIKSAFHILQTSNCASGFHYMLGKGKQIYSIEQAQSALSIMKINGTGVHTNHYIHSRFAKRATVPHDSAQRLKRMHEILDCDIPHILFDKQNRPNPLYARSHDNRRTLSTVMFLPLQKKVVVYNRDSLKDRKTFRWE